MTDLGDITSLPARQAEQAIESLRKGIPPVGMAKQFTVGRKAELDELTASLAQPTEHRGSALLIRANYGAGKSHLLRVIREMALDGGYVVASVTVDSQSGVRFNRMDTILGAVCRTLEVPGQQGAGLPSLFRSYLEADEGDLDAASIEVRSQVSENGRWDLSERLSSPAIYVALRAWATTAKGARARDVAADWLSFPDKYQSTPGRVYDELVGFRGRPFRDPRDRQQFFSDGVFNLRGQGYDQCWRALSDLELLAESCGHQGVVLLFDEFEDVVQNLNNRDYQQKAFVNLFRFFAGDRFPGMAYFAVTPEFVIKCKSELLSRFVYDFPFDRFDDLPHFEMSRIRKADFKALARRIRSLHGVAYDWDIADALDDAALDALVDKLFQRSSQDQIRQAIEGLVEALDDQLQSEDA